MLQWYIVYAKPASEAVAQANLERQDYLVYYPRLLHPTRLRGRWVDRIVPLFPRYLFVHLDVGHQALGPVHSTIGVAGIVRFGHDYAVVPDEVIDKLRMRADLQTGLHRLCEDIFKPGARVRIVAGVFDGLEGVFQRKSADERVIVLLNLLGQEIPVRISAGFVLPREAA